jgi:heme exporter protein B
MNSTWTSETLAIFLKEARTEIRGKTGIATAAVFSLSTVVTIALALYNKDVNQSALQDVCASLIWVVILFTSILTLPRTFLGEEERRTGDLLRLVARPHAVFWGKALFNLAQMWLICAFVSFLFIAITGIHIADYKLLVGCLIFGSASVVGAVTLCGAIAAEAQNRSAMAATIALPLVLIPTQWGVAGLRAAFGSIITNGGQGAAVGLFFYALLSFGLGPWIYAAIWKN